MKILVTGSKGQLGSEISELSKNYRNWHFIHTDSDTLDICNASETQKFIAGNKPDIVINCAAYTAVDKAETDPEQAARVNAMAPGILAKAVKDIGSRLIHISTDYVFDGTKNAPYTEKDQVNPVGVYSRTKLQGEINCMEENKQTVIVRTSWLYSSFGNNFMKTMLKLGRERESLNIVFDQVGTPTYAADLAGALLTIIENFEKDSRSFVSGIYNYSNEGVISWYDFAKAIFEVSKIDCQVNPILSEQYPTPAQRPHYSVLDKTKIKETFGLKIPYWKDSLKDCLSRI